MSYLEFYKLKEQPFSNSFDSRFYFRSAQHAEALIRLRHAVDERKGLAILVGGIGTGKTTLARQLLDELGEKEFESALLIVIHTSITSEWLLRKIAMQLGIQEPAQDKTELLSQLYNRLVEIYDTGKKAVVLIDEAQMLQKKEVMEEFRGLLNVEMDAMKLITFILFGLPELDEYLSLDEPLKQRVSIRYELKTFTENTTEEYIRHRLEVAGCKRSLFAKGSCATIHHYSGGIPRLINTLCDNALLEGFLRKRDVIDQETVLEVAQDLKLAAGSPPA
jgi:type II secretory pathway predicted ATPase ExeA